MLNWIRVGFSSQFLAYFPYFEEIKEGLWDHLALCVSPPPAATNTHAKIEELLDPVFSVRSMLYQILNIQWKIVGD
jgi:hypothetical protein